MHSFKYLCHFCRTSEEHFSQRFQIYILYSHFDLAKYISTTIPAFREFEFSSRVLDWSALKKFCQVGKKDVLTQCPAFCAIFISAKSMFGFPCPPSSENADDEFVLKRLTTLLHLPPFSTFHPRDTAFVLLSQSTFGRELIAPDLILTLHHLPEVVSQAKSKPGGINISRSLF